MGSGTTGRAGGSLSTLLSSRRPSLPLKCHKDKNSLHHQSLSLAPLALEGKLCPRYLIVQPAAALPPPPSLQ